MYIDDEDFKYLIGMARQGADEQVGDMWDFHTDKVDKISKKYKP